MEISLLKEVGLTEGEAKVYLALLELGASTSGPIVKKTKYFQACQPNKILGYIKEREDILKKNKEKIERILPELILKYSLSKNNEAQIYLGIKGIRTAYENLYLKLKKGDEFCFLGILAELSEDQEAYWRKDQKRRINA